MFRRLWRERLILSGSALVLAAALAAASAATGAHLVVIVLFMICGGLCLSAHVLSSRSQHRQIHREAGEAEERQGSERESALRRRLEELTALHQIVLAATAGVGVEHVLENAAAAMHQVLPYPELSIYLVDQTTQRLRVCAGYGPSIARARGLALRVGEGITGTVVATGQAELVNDVRLDSRYIGVIAATRSELCVPMKIGEHVIGGINLESPIPGAFSEDDLRFVSTIAGQLAIILDMARLFDEEQHRSNQLSALHVTSQAVTAQLDKQQLLQAIVRTAAEVFHAAAASVYLPDASGNRLSIVAATGLSERYVREQSIAGDVFATLAEPDGSFPPNLVLDSPHLAARPELLEEEGLRSALAVPLLWGGRPEGILAIYSKTESRSFSRHERELAQIFAGQAAVALENARLFAQASRAEEMIALHGVAATISSSLDPKEVLQTIVNVTAQVMHCPKAALFSLDETRQRLNLEVVYGLSPTFQQEAHDLPTGPGQRGAAALLGPIAVSDVETDPQFSAFADLARREGFRAFLDVPLRSKDRVLGVLTAYFAQPHVFTADEIALMTTIAGQAAVAMENARLYTETDSALRRRVHELTTLQRISLHLVSSLDLDHVLSAITENTLRLTRAAAVHIHLYDEASQSMTLAASRHVLEHRDSPRAEQAVDAVTLAAIRQRQRLVVDNTAADPAFGALEPADQRAGAVAVVPLVHGAAVIGALNVCYAQAHEFTSDELRLLTLLADQAAIAVGNAMLHHRLAEQAKRDSLTQVYNHGYLLEALAAEFAKAQQTGTSLSFILLDIDHFKNFNDQYGHAVGDIVLTSVARAIQTSIRTTDILGRWGGEEFGIVLPGTASTQALAVAQRIRDAVLRMPLGNGLGNHSSRPTVSQGIADWPDHAASPDELVDRADQALYQAKGRGRDQIALAGQDALPLHFLTKRPTT